MTQAGVEDWIRRQLEPEKIPDPVADAALAVLPKLRVPAAQLIAAYQAEIRSRKLEREEQSAMLATAAAGEQPTKAAGKLSSERQAARLLVGEALGDLMHAKLARAVLSERQLEEVLVDFWFNHFNVDARKPQVRATIGAYEQDVIRPHVWGNFRELLGADHGHGTAFLALGGSVKGGKVLGSWPGLAPNKLYEGRDLAITTDYRDFFSEACVHHMGVTAGNLANVFPQFPALPGNFPGYLRS